MYNAHITQQYKGAIMLLIDQSGSMDEEYLFNGQKTTKARAVATIANTLIEEIINRSQRRRGVGDYFDIAVIGYGGDEAKSLFGKRFRRITDVDSMYVPIDNRHVVRQLPNGECLNFFFELRQWVTPVSKGRTPMGAALRMARTMSAAWCRNNPHSFPPIVINISDGEATDAAYDELIRLSNKLKEVATEDGNLLFFNLHITANTDQASVLKWPTINEPLPYLRHSKLLYDMASVLPPLYANTIASLKGHFTPQEYKAVCYNASCDELLGDIQIGSASISQII